MAKKTVNTTSKSKTKTALKKVVKKSVSPTKTIKKIMAKSEPVKTSASKKTASKTVTSKTPKKQIQKKTATKPPVNNSAKVESKSTSTKAKPVQKTERKKIIVEEKPLPLIVNPEVLKPVKSILISQPRPDSGKSAYIDLAEQFKIKLDWRPFTYVEDVKAQDFRKDKVYIEQYGSIIFTSRYAIEHYFRICDELRIKINEDNRYFCSNETIALYLQKFIQYRKRKVFFGDGKLPKLMEIIIKHKEDRKFLLPCSDVGDNALTELLTKHSIDYTEAVIYKTVASDLSDLSDVKYDMLVFFNPLAIDSLYANFPKFKQNETRLAIFGNLTAEAVKMHKLNINIFSPTPQNPSLVDAIKKYITKANK